MKRLATFLTCLLCTLTALTSTAVHAAPSAVHATYQIMRNGLHIADVTERYEVKDNTYNIVSDSKAVGLFALAQRGAVTVMSRGEITRAGLQPVRFDARRGANEARRVIADFDWKTAILKMQFDGRNETAALPAGTQDRLSIMYQFMHTPPVKSRTVEFSMTNGRKIDQYRYSVTPDVTIDTPYRRLVTVHLVKQHEPTETGTEIWLSPDYHFLPVRLLITEEDGVRYDQLLTRLDVTP